MTKSKTLTDIVINFYMLHQMHIYTIFSWISYTICLPLFFFIIIILFFFVFFSSLFSVFFSVWLGLVWVAHAITTTPWPLPFWPSSLFGWRWVAPVAPDIVTLEANSKTSTRRQFVFTSALAPLLQLFFLFSYLAALLLFWFWFVFLFFFLNILIYCHLRSLYTALLNHNDIAQH